MTSRPVAGARCFLRYQNHREYKDCKICESCKIEIIRYDILGNFTQHA